MLQVPIPQSFSPDTHFHWLSVRKAFCPPYKLSQNHMLGLYSSQCSTAISAAKAVQPLKGWLPEPLPLVSSYCSYRYPLLVNWVSKFCGCNRASVQKRNGRAKASRRLEDAKDGQWRIQRWPVEDTNFASAVQSEQTSVAMFHTCVLQSAHEWPVPPILNVHPIFLVCWTVCIICCASCWERAPLLSLLISLFQLEGKLLPLSVFAGLPFRRQQIHHQMSTFMKACICRTAILPSPNPSSNEHIYESMHLQDCHSAITKSIIEWAHSWKHASAGLPLRHQQIHHRMSTFMKANTLTFVPCSPRGKLWKWVKGPSISPDFQRSCC